MTTETWSFPLFIWNVALVVCIAATCWTGGLAFWLPDILGIIDISDTIHSFDYDNPSSISQLINDKSRGLQKLLEYFNGKITSASNILLLFGMPSINFVLYWKDLLVIVLLLFILLLAALF